MAKWTHEINCHTYEGSKAEMGKLWPLGEIWKTSCLLRVSDKLSTVFTFLKWLEKPKKNSISCHMK